MAGCFALVKAVEFGLRPLVVHMDNGWNSELAQNNIQNLVEKLNVDMVTHVIDWDEYRSMMEAFFVANVIDIELLYDNFMFSMNYRTITNLTEIHHHWLEFPNWRDQNARRLELV